MSTSSKLYKAIKKSLTSRYLVYLTNLLSLMALSRLFTPETFGITASITVILSLFQAIAEAGLSPAIINLKSLTEENKNGIYGLSILVGAILGLGFYSLTPIFQSFYNLEQISAVTPFAALSLFFFSASIVPSSFLLRQQAFFKITKAGILAEILSSSLSISLLQILDPLQALCMKLTTNSAMLSAFYLIYSKETEFGRPRPGLKLSAIKPLLSFSLYQLGFNTINYFSRNLDNILVGKYLGSTALGIYEKSYQIMKYPLMLLTFAMTPAIQPTIREIHRDKVAVENIHRSFISKLSFLGILSGIGVYFFSDVIVSLILGNQWSSVSPIIKILSISIPIQIITSTSGSFFQAMERTDLLFLSGVLSAITTISAIFIGLSSKNIEYLCWGIVIAFNLNAIQVYCIMYICIFKKSPSRFLVMISPIFIFALLASLYTLYK